MADFVHKGGRGGGVQPKSAILCEKILQRGEGGRYPTNPPLFDKKKVFVGPNTLLLALFNQFSALLVVQHNCTFLPATFSTIAPPLMTT